MKRKAIEAVPMLERELKQTKEDYTVFSQLVEIKGEKILILDLYKTRCISKKSKLIPEKRYVTDRRDFETYNPKNTKPWGKAGLETSWYCMPDLYFPAGAAVAVYEFLPPASWGDSAEKRLQENERDIKSETAQKKKEYHQNAIDRRISLVKDFPKGAVQWFYQLFEKEHFIFYETQTKVKAAGVCSHCQKEIIYDRRAEKPMHNMPCKCPYCGIEGLYKVKGKQDQVHVHKKAIIMQKIEGGFVSRFLELKYRASPLGESIDFDHVEVARSTYNGKRRYDDYSYYRYYTDEITWTDSNVNNINKGIGYLYLDNLEEVLDRTPFKYCALGELQKHTNGPIHHTALLENYERMPYIEYMIKMGLYRLTEEYLEHPYTSTINYKEKRPDKILNLPKDKIKQLITENGGLDMLKRLQVEVILNRSFTEEEVNIIQRHKVNVEQLPGVMEYTGMTRFLRYMSKSLDSRQEAGNFILDWKDYIRMQQTSGLQLTTANLFPRSLKAEHDKMLKTIKDMEDLDKNKKYQEIKGQYVDRYSFEYKDLVIIIPETLQDIVKEGNKQHHCVATYVDRVAAGQTCILFLRKKEEPDQPFYTMEIQGTDIIQCRGKCNADQTSEVKSFLKAFKTYIEKQKFEADRIPA